MLIIKDNHLLQFEYQSLGHCWCGVEGLNVSLVPFMKYVYVCMLTNVRRIDNDDIHQRLK